MDKEKIERAGFVKGVNWYRAHLFHKMSEETPQMYGEHWDSVYPMIPCLVKGFLSTGYEFGILWWDVTQQCWVKEQGNFYDYSKDEVEEWAYIDDII